METKQKNGWLLRCDTCGHIVLCKLSEVERYRRDGWPKHCGETMSIFVQTGRPESPTELMPDRATEVMPKRPPAR